MARWADRLKEVQKYERHVKTALVAANNHYAGFGPARMCYLKVRGMIIHKKVRCTFVYFSERVAVLVICNITRIMYKRYIRIRKHVHETLSADSPNTYVSSCFDRNNLRSLVTR